MPPYRNVRQSAASSNSLAVASAAWQFSAQSRFCPEPLAASARDQRPPALRGRCPSAPHRWRAFAARSWSGMPSTWGSRLQGGRARMARMPMGPLAAFRGSVPTRQATSSVRSCSRGSNTAPALRRGCRPPKRKAPASPQQTAYEAFLWPQAPKPLARSSRKPRRGNPIFSQSSALPWDLPRGWRPRRDPTAASRCGGHA
mmetsp:Transcript_85602/g.239052  ORF Transcript_85602/g.239052 Transcript_85602/m.239052 type:complete len:200 (-) Transcript_85602:293-892(-)